MKFFHIVAALSAVCPLFGQASGTDWISQVKNKPFSDPRFYDFRPRAAAGSLSASTPATYTFTPCPLGVGGADPNHYLYISGGTGTAEPVLITGGTCTSGATTGTVLFTPANSHSGAWTIQSSNNGVSEAFNACATPCEVQIPAGDWTWHGPVETPPVVVLTAHHYTLGGRGDETSKITVASDFPLSAPGIIIGGSLNAPGYGLNGPEIHDLGILEPQPWSSPLSSYTHWPPTVYSTGLNGTQMRNMYIAGAWTGFYLHGYPNNSACAISEGQFDIDHVYMSAFHIGIDIDCTTDINRIHDFHFWPFTDIAPTSPNVANFYDPSVLGISFGNLNGAQGLDISDSFISSGSGIKIYSGSIDVVISNTMFDGGADLKMGGVPTYGADGSGNVALVNSTFYDTGSCAHPMITAGDGIDIVGELIVTNSMFYRGCTSQPLLKVNGNTVTIGEEEQVTFSNNQAFDTSGSASTGSLFVLAGQTANVQVSMTGNQIGYVAPVAYTNPMLSLTGPGSGIQLTFVGNTNAGSGSGVWLNIANDSRHVLSANSMNTPNTDWHNVLPAQKILGIYEDQQFTYPKPYPVYAAATSGLVNMTGYQGFYVCNATGGAVGFQLPFVNSVYGAEYVLKKTDATANACTLFPGIGEAIDGSASKSITTQYGIIRVKAGPFASGTWYVE